MGKNAYLRPHRFENLISAFFQSLMGMIRYASAVLWTRRDQIYHMELDTQLVERTINQTLGYHLFPSPGLNVFCCFSYSEGKIYDSTDPEIVLHQIQSFVSTYSIDTSELLEPDLTKYPV